MHLIMQKGFFYNTNLQLLIRGINLLNLGKNSTITIIS